MSEHFDFGLYGETDNGNNYHNESGKQFAYAYYRDELKAKDIDADILAKVCVDRHYPKEDVSMAHYLQD